MDSAKYVIFFFGLCSPDLRRYHTTLRWSESVHFLWPLIRKFSGLLVRPSAVADGKVFAVNVCVCVCVCVNGLLQLLSDPR